MLHVLLLLAMLTLVGPSRGAWAHSQTSYCLECGAKQRQRIYGPIELPGEIAATKVSAVAASLAGRHQHRWAFAYSGGDGCAIGGGRFLADRVQSATVASRLRRLIRDQRRDQAGVLLRRVLDPRPGLVTLDEEVPY